MAENEENLKNESAQAAQESFVKIDLEQPDAPTPAGENKEPQNGKCKSSGCKCGLIVDCVLVAAVIALFILYFCGGKCCKKDTAAQDKAIVATAVPGNPGSGEVLFINLDTIQEHYIYFQQKKKELETELSQQEALFTGKQQSFQKKYAQFQQNMQAGILTDIQMQNTQQQLEAEYSKLEADMTAARNKIDEKTSGVNKSMLDSLKASSARISATRKASYVFTYSEEMPILICADPTKDITDQVLKDMNAPFEKENK